MRTVVFLGSLFSCLSWSSFAQTELIVNGGFETLTHGEWVISGNNASQKSNPTVPHGGASYLGLGFANSPTTQLAYQAIFLPTNTVAAFLSYFYDVFSSVPNNDTSVLYVEVYTNGNLAATVDVKSASDSTGPSEGTAYYGQRIFDLTPFAGKTNQIVFRTQMGTLGSGTAFDIDDVSVLVETTADIPPNDHFTNSTALTGVSGTAFATNKFASKEPGEPNHAGNAGGRSLWWHWTAPVDGVAQFNTANSTFATLLAVYSGTTLSNLARVASDNSSLELDAISAVRFAARAGVVYQIAVDGVKDGSLLASGTVSLNFLFKPDTSPPRVVISSPVAGAKVTNSTIIVRGAATDNVAVALVRYRLENANGTNAYQDTIGTNHWSAVLADLVPGPNRIRLLAFDTSSNFSSTVTRTFNYVVVSPINLSATGNGTLSPDYRNRLLEIRKKYVVTARPGPGQIFANWTGDIDSSNPKLAFTMQSNLVLQANFIPNPFLPVKGSYAGLFYGDQGIYPTNAGFFSARVTDKGGFTAKLVLPLGSASIAGKFSFDGSYSNAIARPRRSPILFQAQLDLNSGDVITGTVSDGTQTAGLTAYRAIYSRANPSPLAGKKYTLVFPGSDDSAAGPGGDGFGAAVVDASGNITFSGSLGDGTKVLQKTFLSATGQWPFFGSPYSRKGIALGWFAVDAAAVNGNATWVKQPQPGAKLYPLGFDFQNSVQAVGSVYSFSPGSPLLTWTSGEVVLQAANLSGSITNPFTIGPNYKVTGPNHLNLTLTPSTGLFHGSVADTSTGKKIPIKGSLLQNQDSGYGLFLNADQSGSVMLLPQ